MDANADLATFFPELRTETIAGVTLTIPNLKVRQLAPFGKAADPFMPLILTGDYLAVVTHHTDAVCAAVSMVTGAEPEWMGNLDPDEMMRLVAAVFEVNLDFFAQRLLPQKAALQARMVQLLVQLAGEQASLGSSDTDTALPNAPN